MTRNGRCGRRAAQSGAHDVDLQSAAHIPRHAARVGVAPRALDGDHQAVRFELAAEPDKGLEHVRSRSGIRAGVAPQAGDQLDPVGRHRAVMPIQPSAQPGLFEVAVPITTTSRSSSSRGYSSAMTQSNQPECPEHLLLRALTDRRDLWQERTERRLLAQAPED